MDEAAAAAAARQERLRALQPEPEPSSAGQRQPQQPQQPQHVDVEVPEGAAAGDVVQATTESGVAVEFVLPEGARAGAVLRVEMAGGAAGPRDGDGQTTLYDHLLAGTAKDAEAAVARDRKNGRKLQGWVAAKLAAYDADAAVRRSRLKQHASREGYEAFLSHRSQQRLAQARRDNGSLDHSTQLQAPADAELHEVDGLGRVLIAARDFERHQLILCEKPAVTLPPAQPGADRLQAWGDQVDAVCRLPTHLRRAVLELPGPDPPRSGPLREDLDSLADKLAQSPEQQHGLSSDEVRSVPMIWGARRMPMRRGGALLAIAGHFPHSCDGSVGCSEDSDGAHLEFRALRRIQRGEMLTLDYFPKPKFAGAAERRAELMSTRRFRCACVRCTQRDTVAALPCPACNPAAEGHRLAQSTMGYIARQVEDDCAAAACDTCTSVFATADLEGLMRWEQQAVVLVHGMAAEVSRSRQPELLHERLRGLYFAVLRLVGWKHWTVTMVRLMQLRSAMNKPGVRASQIASLLGHLFRWFEDVHLDPVRYIGPDSVTAAATALRKCAGPLPMLAAQYYAAVQQSTPADTDRSLELARMLHECQTETEQQVGEDRTGAGQDAFGAEEASDSDEDVDSTDLGKGVMSQAHESGVLDYIQRSFRSCASADQLDEMHTRLRQEFAAFGDPLVDERDQRPWASRPPPSLDKTTSPKCEDMRVDDWLAQCGAEPTAKRALQDFGTVAEVALLCTERDDLVFLGVAEAEANILWRSIAQNYKK